ncbi:MAG: hypothetical protein H7282_05030 [Cytophagaceae bacterium]|nr:hypothetical protein [Cytophagaceae bacterium]
MRVISTEIDSLTRLITKFYRFGKSDVQTAVDASPYGVDGNPIKDMTAVYMQTGTKGKTVLVGYLNKNRLAAPGELRLFATDASGAEQTFIWLKGDGTMNLAGDADNIVRYSPLNEELSDFKTAIQQQLVLIASGIAAGGGSYSPGTLMLDLTDAKVVEVKTTGP